jgi:hypothetical protein
LAFECPRTSQGWMISERELARLQKFRRTALLRFSNLLALSWYRVLFDRGKTGVAVGHQPDRVFQCWFHDLLKLAGPLSGRIPGV